MRYDVGEHEWLDATEEVRAGTIEWVVRTCPVPGCVLTEHHKGTCAVLTDGRRTFRNTAKASPTPPASPSPTTNLIFDLNESDDDE